MQPISEFTNTEEDRMSFNRENVIWQSANGTWSIGFFECFEVNGDGGRNDPEWDVEYNYEKFDWASTNHSTKEAARKAWHGANPGGGETLSYSKENSDECDGYDRMAKEYLDTQRQIPRARLSYY